MSPTQRRRDARGSAVVDFVLVMVVLVPSVLGIIQVGLVMHVRATLAAAASEGARLAATVDRGPGDGVALARSQIDAALSGTYAQHVTAHPITIDGQPGIEITVRAEVPALGLGGPGVALSVSGRAVEELP